MATTKKSETKKTNSELALEAHDREVKNAKQAKTSEMENMMGKTKEITLCKGTDKEYTVVLQFPGVGRAMEIEDIAANRYNNLALSIFMQECVKDVIVSPKISSVNYWNSHPGLDELTPQVVNFLNKGLAGQL
ncbi:MAG: hypothetical protein [Bacteriophage sp.]|nr:MAG: hypothetical protein [Bacteriophage sp.]